MISILFVLLQVNDYQIVKVGSQIAAELKRKIYKEHGLTTSVGNRLCRIIFRQ